MISFIFIIAISIIALNRQLKVESLEFKIDSIPDFRFKSNFIKDYCGDININGFFLFCFFNDFKCTSMIVFEEITGKNPLIPYNFRDFCKYIQEIEDGNK